MGFTPPYLEVRKITGGWGIYGPSSTTTDDLTIYPNTTDAYGRIKLNGAGAVAIVGVLGVYTDAGVQHLTISYTSPDLTFDSIIADKNIFLKTTGAGLLKFGTYTAGSATDSTGYITILDASGNTRKLMVQA